MQRSSGSNSITLRTCTLQAGDLVNVDVTAYYQGYHGDLNETFVVGEVDEESKKLTKVAYEVLIRSHCPHTQPRLRTISRVPRAVYLTGKCRWACNSSQVLTGSCAAYSA